MHKLFLIVALTLPCTSLVLAKRAADELPLRIDVDGHLLRMRVAGAGTPTVVLEIGLGGPLEEWAAVQPAVAKFTRVVAYDRIGANHRGPVLTGRDVAAELHAALVKANLPPPYVLVGQSFGGVYNQSFASLYPNEVAGMVLLDPTTEKFILWMRERHPEKEFTILRHSDWPEAAGILATFDELRGGDPLPDIPVVVVTAARHVAERWFSEKVLPVWTANHEALAQSFPQGRHVITEKSGHAIHIEQPELVIDLIRNVVAQARGAQSTRTASEKSPGVMP